MIAKHILYLGNPLILACDAKCEKAWGHNRRPKVQLDPSNEDDYEYLADGELPVAPVDPGTYEGGHAKPAEKADRLNKWCCRECERSVMVKYGEDFDLPDFSKRVRNIKESAD